MCLCSRTCPLIISFLHWLLWWRPTPTPSVGEGIAFSDFLHLKSFLYWESPCGFLMFSGDSCLVPNIRQFSSSSRYILPPGMTASDFPLSLTIFTIPQVWGVKLFLLHLGFPSFLLLTFIRMQPHLIVTMQQHTLSFFLELFILSEEKYKQAYNMKKTKNHNTIIAWKNKLSWKFWEV